MRGVTGKIAVMVAAGKSAYDTDVVGTDYFPRMWAELNELSNTTGKVETFPWGGAESRMKAEFALVPMLENDYNGQAIAVVLLRSDGTVAAENQVGWIPNRLCHLLQPSIRSMARAVGGHVGAKGTLTRWTDEDDQGDANTGGGLLTLRIAHWMKVRDQALLLARKAEPNVEQPWLEHRAPRSKLSTRLYDQGRGRSEADLVPVTYELRDDHLVATVHGELLTDLTKGGRSFFDLLRKRVEREGPVEGWVRLHSGSVGVRIEARPPRSDWT